MAYPDPLWSLKSFVSLEEMLHISSKLKWSWHELKAKRNQKLVWKPPKDHPHSSLIIFYCTQTIGLDSKLYQLIWSPLLTNDTHELMTAKQNTDNRHLKFWH